MSISATLRNWRNRTQSKSQTPRPSGLFEGLKRENEQLRKENKNLRERLAKEEKENAELEKKANILKKEIQDRNKKIDDLEHQLVGWKKNSSNSSKPPSSDGPAAPKRVYPKRKKTGRKPGGQKGHPGAHLALVPPEQVNETIEKLPSTCNRCNHVFSAKEKSHCQTGDVHRHQVAELPPIKPFITEYRFIAVICPDCGQIVWEPVPKEIRSYFGPRLTAFLGYVTVDCRMPRRKTQDLLQNAFNIQVSLGSTQKAVEESSNALESSYKELEQQIGKEDVINGDESSWRSNGEKRWLWVFVARWFVFFIISKTRSTEVLFKYLGAQFMGILCSDRFIAYIKYHKGVAQFCWAHLKRDLLGIQQFARTTIADHFARDALALYVRLFRLWHKFKRGDFDRDLLIQKSIPLEKKFFELAEKHLDCAEKEVRNIARFFFTHTESLFAFIKHPGVEPTNNGAEHAIRTAVQWRKTSFGNRSQNGEVATARLLTAAGTCKMQGRNIFEFLAETIKLHRAGLPTPSLLPQKQ